MDLWEDPQRPTVNNKKAQLCLRIQCNQSTVQAFRKAETERLAIGPNTVRDWGHSQVRSDGCFLDALGFYVQILADSCPLSASHHLAIFWRGGLHIRGCGWIFGSVRTLVIVSLGMFFPAGVGKKIIIKQFFEKKSPLRSCMSNLLHLT